jgi:hypothetical protein
MEDTEKAYMEVALYSPKLDEIWILDVTVPSMWLQFSEQLELGTWGVDSPLEMLGAL